MRSAYRGATHPAPVRTPASGLSSKRNAAPPERTTRKPLRPAALSTTASGGNRHVQTAFVDVVDEAAPHSSSNRINRCRVLYTRVREQTTAFPAPAGVKRPVTRIVSPSSLT